MSELQEKYRILSLSCNYFSELRYRIAFIQYLAILSLYLTFLNYEGEKKSELWEEKVEITLKNNYSLAEMYNDMKTLLQGWTCMIFRFK